MAATARLGKGGGYSDAPLIHEGRMIFDKKEKAELAASSLTDVFTTNKLTVKALQIRADRVRDSLNLQSSVIQEELPNITMDRVVKIIKSKSRKSAPGEDRLTYRVLGVLHLRALEKFRDILVASVEFGEVPDCWKSASIVLIPKGSKDPGRLENRMPISLINTMAKVLEVIVKEELQEFLEENRKIPANQFGFRARLSATQQAMHLAGAIVREDRPQSRAAVALFDLEKAYDKVWRAGLLLKMVELEIPQWCTRWVRDWLEDRSFRVRMGEQHSEW